MRKLLSIFLFCSLLVIVSFLLFGNMQQWMEKYLHSARSLQQYAVLSFIFLTSDIVLPIPSSLFMILNGKVLGIFAGSAISFFSGLLSSCIGFYLGRKSNGYLNRFFSRKEEEHSNRLFDKFGKTAITISRAIPVLSETISFLSGATALTFGTFVLYAIPGHFMVSLIYAYVGKVANYADSWIISGSIILGTLILGWILQLAMKKRNRAL